MKIICNCQCSALIWNSQEYGYDNYKQQQLCQLLYCALYDFFVALARILHCKRYKVCQTLRERTVQLILCIWTSLHASQHYVNPQILTRLCCPKNRFRLVAETSRAHSLQGIAVSRLLERVHDVESERTSKLSLSSKTTPLLCFCSCFGFAVVLWLAKHGGRSFRKISQQIVERPQDAYHIIDIFKPCEYPSRFSLHSMLIGFSDQGGLGCTYEVCAYSTSILPTIISDNVQNLFTDVGTILSTTWLRRLHGPVLTFFSSLSSSWP